MTRTDVESDRLTTTTPTMADRVRRQLLELRMVAGHWEGELSSSALSTATASFALWLYARSTADEAGAAAMRLSAAGIRWLASNQNADGGWGDTTKSRSNISTTALCWAALGAAGGDVDVERAVAHAAAWLTAAAGSTQPAALSDAIARRYGDDRTFSVPILTTCALAGRFGNGTEAWRHVPQLPFELASLPQGFYRFVRLPVVSYALPALIAIGLVRHHHRPSWNPLGRSLRVLTRARTLRVLEGIQPESGGFLEATPLTSFVAMSLVAAGEVDHPVVRRGIEFLSRSVRPDGSWPIDTNLATWVTTLSVNALAADGRLHEHLGPPERANVRRWLVAQQYRKRHPYTGAAPGGWAWTDLSGGVPDADDTAGALIALHRLGEIDSELIDAASAGIDWLLGIQNRDGGVPTFCRGWGTLPFDRSAPELTAHALHAWRVWHPHLPRALAGRVEAAIGRGVAYLREHQRSDGSWVPLWFGNEAADGEANPTYGTSRVLAGLCALGAESMDGLATVHRGVAWLCSAQNEDGGWGGQRGVPSSLEETGYATHALASCRAYVSEPPVEAAIRRAIGWLGPATRGGTTFAPTPVGLYFAKLWYFERLYPLIATMAALSRASGLER